MNHNPPAYAQRDHTHVFILHEDETIAPLIISQLQKHPESGSITGFHVPRRDQPNVELRIDLRKTCKKSVERVLGECFGELKNETTRLEEAMKEAFAQFELSRPRKKICHPSLASCDTS